MYIYDESQTNKLKTQKAHYLATSSFMLLNNLM